MSATSDKADAAGVCPWPAWQKAVISALVSVHLLAVFIAPLWFASGEDSPAVEPVARVLRPYINALFLNHGYAFFAPDPGPNHLVQYRLTFDDGRPDVVARFPDVKTQRPRLLYHRHFMLSESLYTYSNLPEPPADAPPEAHAQYHARRAHYRALQASLANHLKYKHGASGAVLQRIEHRQPLPAEFQTGAVRLDAPELYRNLDEAGSAGDSQ